MNENEEDIFVRGKKIVDWVAEAKKCIEQYNKEESRTDCVEPDTEQSSITEIVGGVVNELTPYRKSQYKNIYTNNSNIVLDWKNEVVENFDEIGMPDIRSDVSEEALKKSPDVAGLRKLCGTSWSEKTFQDVVFGNPLYYASQMLGNICDTLSSLGELKIKYNKEVYSHLYAKFLDVFNKMEETKNKMHSILEEITEN